ncbi:hypothetical protein HDU78_005864 [Chytriomyces hyalinus]|nr:hypothetical protein HDU78_005864 [Chytriomyces hyalinus]
MGRKDKQTDEKRAEEDVTGMGLLLQLDKYLLLQSECGWLDGDTDSLLTLASSGPVGSTGSSISLSSASALARGDATRKQIRADKYKQFLNYTSAASRAATNPILRIPDTFESWQHYVKCFRVPLLEEARAEMASNAGLFSAGGIVRFRRLEVVAWGKGWDNPSKNGVRNGGRSSDYGSSMRDSRRRGKGRMAFDDDYYNCLDDDASEPTEVNANAYYENPEDWERDPADMGPDYSNVMLKIRPNELRMGDVLLISEVDVTNSEDYALDQDFVSNRKSSVSDSTKESMPNNPLLSKIGILHVNMVRSNYYDRKKKRTYDAVASCTVSQFPTPSSAHPSFMYISEVLTSSVPVNRVYASLMDADDEPDRLSTENLRRAILEGRFDYAREVAEMSITGVPVEGLNSSQQRAHDAAIATVAVSGVCLIQGPPGTGKTKTTASIMTTILNRLQTKILQCAPTNIAMVSVGERLVASRKQELGPELFDPLESVIVGNRDKLKDIMSPGFQQYSLEIRVEMVAKCPLALMKRLDKALKMTEDDVLESNSDSRNKQQRNANQKKSKSRSKATVTEQELTHEKVKAVFEAVRVYCNEMRDLVGAAAHIEVSLVEPFDLIHKFVDLIIALRGPGKDGKAGDKTKTVANPHEVVLSAAERLVPHLGETICLDTFGDLDQSKKSIQNMEKALKKLFLAKARAIFSTLNATYSSHLIDEESFNVVIVDEAAQAMEADTTCILRHCVKAVILVGDTKQLEATVKSETCATARFGRSLVERLQSLKHPVYMLETQYRMHPRIAEFSSGQFYDGWLMDSAFVRTYNPSWYANPEFSPVQFIAHRGSRHVKDNGGSSKNDIEAQLICDRLIAFLGSHSTLALSIGIICPYKAQKHLLDELLEDALAPIQHRSEISVNTVDGFQGQERDVIILSLVRVEHVSGFLDDLRRVNVALTRAKYNLWVYGDHRTYDKSLGQFGSFGWFYSHCHKRGFVKVVDERGKDAGSGALMVDAGTEGAGWDGRMSTHTLADDGHEKVREEFKHGNNRGGDLKKEEAEQALLDAWSAAFDD